MNTIAWNYYEPGGHSLREEAKVAKDSLILAVAIYPHHLLALHLTVHLFEPSSDPDFIQFAVAAGDMLTRVSDDNCNDNQLNSFNGIILYFDNCN